MSKQRRSLAAKRGWLTRKRRELARKRNLRARQLAQQRERQKRSLAAKKAWRKKKQKLEAEKRKRSAAARRAWERRRARERAVTLAPDKQYAAFLDRGEPVTKQLYEFARDKGIIKVNVELEYFEDNIPVESIRDTIEYEVSSDMSEDDFRRMHNDAIREWLNEVTEELDIEYDQGSLWFAAAS